jgi:hypothetical protein
LQFEAAQAIYAFGFPTADRPRYFFKVRLRGTGDFFTTASFNAGFRRLTPNALSSRSSRAFFSSAVVSFSGRWETRICSFAIHSRDSVAGCPMVTIVSESALPRTADHSSCAEHYLLLVSSNHCGIPAKRVVRNRVASENLGISVGLAAGAALLIDYILNLAWESLREWVLWFPLIPCCIHTRVTAGVPYPSRGAPFEMPWLRTQSRPLFAIPTARGRFWWVSSSPTRSNSYSSSAAEAACQG